MIADANMRNSGTDYPVSITWSEALKCRKMVWLFNAWEAVNRQLKYNVTVLSEPSICVFYIYIFFIFALCHVNNTALNTCCNFYSSIMTTPKRQISSDSFFLIYVLTNLIDKRLLKSPAITNKGINNKKARYNKG